MFQVFLPKTGSQISYSFSSWSSNVKLSNNAWVRGDMEILFSFSTWYLTSERSEQLRYRVEHEKGNSGSLSIICPYMKTIRAKQAIVNFGYFVQINQHGTESQTA